MRVTLFGYSRLNPYLSLFKTALERQGLTVSLEPALSLGWLITRGRSCDTIHLHWIETAYEPAIKSWLGRRLVKIRLVKAMCGVLRLVNFLMALWLARLQGKTIVYTVHNLNPHDQAFRPFVFLHRIAQRVVLSLADQVHTHNYYARQLVETAYHCRHGVAVVPLGNYIGHYPNRVSRSAARRDLGMPDDMFVFLSLGLVRPYKGLEELIGAFEGLGEPASQLWIVGRTLNLHYGETIANQTRNNPAITLVPDYVPDEAIQRYMKACDICVLPYRDLTTSSAAVLAWSFGRPVIAPAISSFPELVTAETGLLYDPAQPDALALALQRAKQCQWSEPKILDYAHQFDWDRLGPQLADLYVARNGRR